MQAIYFSLVILALVSSSLTLPAPAKKTDEISPQNLEQLAQLVASAKASVNAEGQENDIKGQVMNLLQKALDEPMTPPAILVPSDGGDEVSNVLTDIVNTITEINGLNSMDINDEEVVTNLIGLGNLQVLAGSSGTTTQIRVGNIVDTVGAIQGQWYNFDVANVNIQVKDD